MFFPVGVQFRMAVLSGWCSVQNGCSFRLVFSLEWLFFPVGIQFNMPASSGIHHLLVTDPVPLRRAIFTKMSLIFLFSSHCSFVMLLNSCSRIALPSNSKDITFI